MAGSPSTSRMRVTSWHNQYQLPTSWLGGQGVGGWIQVVFIRKGNVEDSPLDKAQDLLRKMLEEEVGPLEHLAPYASAPDAPADMKDMGRFVLAQQNAPSDLLSFLVDQLYWAVMDLAGATGLSIDDLCDRVNGFTLRTEYGPVWEDGTKKHVYYFAIDWNEED